MVKKAATMTMEKKESAPNVYWREKKKNKSFNTITFYHQLRL